MWNSSVLSESPNVSAALSYDNKQQMLSGSNREVLYVTSQILLKPKPLDLKESKNNGQITHISGILT